MLLLLPFWNQLRRKNLHRSQPPHFQQGKFIYFFIYFVILNVCIFSHLIYFSLKILFKKFSHFKISLFYAWYLSFFALKFILFQIFFSCHKLIFYIFLGMPSKIFTPFPVPYYPSPPRYTVIYYCYLS